MAANLYKNQSTNITKTWFLMVGFFIFIMLIGWFASYYYNDSLILYIAVLFSVGMNITSYWFSDKIVLKIAGAKEAKKSEYYDLYTIVENLSITAGLPMPKVYVIEESVPNAFATGRNKNHAVVAFTTGLLAILEKNELEGVAAHELAHIGNKDILLQTVVVVLVGFITLLADFLTRSMFFGGRDNDRGGGQLQVILLIAGIALTILSPLIGTMIQLAISRKREFLADATGVLLTRYPEGLASALEKIHASSAQMKRANHATAHLYISDPFGSKASLGGKKEKVGFMHKLFLTHPPVQERLAALRG